jgi:hypothetical protein
LTPAAWFWARGARYSVSRIIFFPEAYLPVGAAALLPEVPATVELPLEPVDADELPLEELLLLLPLLLHAVAANATTTSAEPSNTLLELLGDLIT